MKKINVLATLLLFSLACSALFGQDLGDVNHDNEVNIVDALLVAKYYVNDIPSGFDAALADVDCDASINIVDALNIARFYVRLISELPCGHTPTPTVTQTPTPVVNPGADYLLVGRFTNETAPRFAWSASTIKANFSGTEVSVKLASTGDNYIEVIVDGQVKAPVNVPSGSSGSSAILLASGLSNGNHSIEIVKRTEAHVGDMQFFGFEYGSGRALAAPAPSSRRIEFIGDSITCGYGNEGNDRNQPFTTRKENAYMAYGALTGRLVNADAVTVCWSGKGVIRNYGGDTNNVMPQVYDQILAYNTSLLWDYSKWIPQVVVINLGTNDYSVGNPDRAQFTTAYRNLVTKVRGHYPSAYIYVALGPLQYGDGLISARDYLSSIVTGFNNSGDSKIRFIEFPQQDGSLGYGEDWHPTVATHQQMAGILAAKIRSDLGWN
ncbi:MAG: hypothetical protein JXR70_06130 [Spirochaetales bacterium]|nr:hypothetical protein [Spirochaetales bacterium]